jgi:antitoxin component of RelBE/YafQ-DinJ toxin-antitoxin module
MGLSVSDAVRAPLVRLAAEKALPFDVKVSNATSVKALEARPTGAKESATASPQPRQPAPSTLPGRCGAAGK